MDSGDIEDGGEVTLGGGKDSPDFEGSGSSYKKKGKKVFEIPEHEKNQIRDKIKRNQDGGLDERKIQNISQIKCKIRRNAEWLKLKREKKKDKKARQEARKREAEALGDDAPPKLVPKTIDSMREYDETTVGGKEGTEDDEEVEHDISNDEFASYFEKTYVPKVLITCGDNPHSRTIAFMKELTRIIPNSEPRWRNKSSVKKNCQRLCVEGIHRYHHCQRRQQNAKWHGCVASSRRSHGSVQTKQCQSHEGSSEEP